MKLLKLSFLFAFIFAMASCGGDDDASTSCVQADWVGTYTGTANCDGTTEDVTVSITASGTDAVLITWETTTVKTEYDPLNFDGCEISDMQSTSGVSSSVEVTLNGNSLSIDEAFTFSGITSNCSLTATRQ